MSDEIKSKLGFLAIENRPVLISIGILLAISTLMNACILLLASTASGFGFIGVQYYFGPAINILIMLFSLACIPIVKYFSQSATIFPLYVVLCFGLPFMAILLDFFIMMLMPIQPGYGC